MTFGVMSSVSVVCVPVVSMSRTSISRDGLAVTSTFWPSAGVTFAASFVPSSSSLSEAAPARPSDFVCEELLILPAKKYRKREVFQCRGREKL